MGTNAGLIQIDGVTIAVIERDCLGCGTTDDETCSWCTTEVPDSTLVETQDGARICRVCANTDEGPERDLREGPVVTKSAETPDESAYYASITDPAGRPDHTHECRRCGSEIDCGRPESECVWEGDNDNCPNAEAEEADTLAIMAGNRAYRKDPR